MKLIFMGTPQFSVPILQALIDSEDEVIAVVAQPDKPKGRGRKLTAPPTKELAQKYEVPVLQPAKIKTEEFHNELKSLGPDLICVAAYGKILSKNILDLPKHGCINVHASLLPRYRGAAPINWAIMRGEAETGVTIMQMDEGMDTGDMLLVQSVPITEDDTSETMHDKLSSLGGGLILDAIELLKEGKLTPERQDDSLATYAPMLKKQDGEIDWSKPARDIFNQIRGLLPWPGAFTRLNSKILKIYRSKVSEGSGVPGQIIESDDAIIRVATGDGTLDILELQLEGGKRLAAGDFLRGRPLSIGTQLG